MESDKNYLINDLPIFNVDFDDGNIISSMEATLIRAKIVVSLDSWMNFGSEDWNKTSSEIKNNIYKALVDDGWKDAAITGVISRRHPFLSETILEIILSELKGKKSCVK